jgi:hypothetical protein
MTILSSINPDMKIRASAAMEASKRRSINVDRTNNKKILEDQAQTFDLQNCLYYVNRKPAFKYSGKCLFL